MSLGMKFALLGVGVRCRLYGMNSLVSFLANQLGGVVVDPKRVSSKPSPIKCTLNHNPRVLRLHDLQLQAMGP